MTSGSVVTQANIFPCLYYDDASAAIDWLGRAFGFTKRLVVPGPDGTIVHAEMSYGPGVIMVGSSRPDTQSVSPRRLPAVNQALCVHVDDPDAHYAHARAAGAEIIQELKNEEFGSRGYMAKDLEGNHWYFGTYRPGAAWTVNTP
jgi:uncharacterized glyoxalase superfamily protein PhnB